MVRKKGSRAVPIEVQQSKKNVRREKEIVDTAAKMKAGGKRRQRSSKPRKTEISAPRPGPSKQSSAHLKQKAYQPSPMSVSTDVCTSGFTNPTTFKIPGELAPVSTDPREALSVTTTGGFDPWADGHSDAVYPKGMIGVNRRIIHPEAGADGEFFVVGNTHCVPWSDIKGIFYSNPAVAYTAGQIDLSLTWSDTNYVGASFGASNMGALANPAVGDDDLEVVTWNIGTVVRIRVNSEAPLAQSGTIRFGYFVHNHSDHITAAQLDNNPYGFIAPASYFNAKDDKCLVVPPDPSPTAWQGDSCTQSATVGWMSRGTLSHGLWYVYGSDLPVGCEIEIEIESAYQAYGPGVPMQYIRNQDEMCFMHCRNALLIALFELSNEQGGLGASSATISKLRKATKDTATKFALSTLPTYLFKAAANAFPGILESLL